MLSIDDLSKGRHFYWEIIILCVRWYLRFKLSFRDLAEMMAERAVVQSCLFEAKSYNRVLNNQWLASLNFPVLGNLHQSRKFHDFWSRCEGVPSATIRVSRGLKCSAMRLAAPSFPTASRPSRITSTF
jgi:hypothetical protein